MPGTCQTSDMAVHDERHGLPQMPTSISYIFLTNDGDSVYRRRFDLGWYENVVSERGRL